MKRLIYICLLSSLLPAVGCKKEWDIPGMGDPEYTNVYLVQASKIQSYQLEVTEAPDTILLSAGFGGVGTPDGNLEITLSAALHLVDSFNNARKTQYLPLPESAYTLEGKDNKLVIHTGKTTSAGSPLVIRAFGKLRMDKEYLLPVSIAAVNGGVKVNEPLRTAYLIIKPKPVLFNPTGWQMLSLTSEEPAEGNSSEPDNGKAIAMFDGKNQTFWHSQWNGGYAVPPHILAVDMKTSRTLSGISLVPRQGRVGAGGNFKGVKVEVSADGTTWTAVNNGAPFELPNTDDRKFLFFPEPVSCRYFRIVIAETQHIWGGVIFTHCAEMTGF
ncbi:discoidin domain-containing protein [Chitinophaga pollutisoli]|uniref:Discoidin domain-containing protein n=1 Tax=Chitinophaga pollutisoli TaxID=3133966 RepID=A0ABZ2YPZ5_9BACT